MVSKTTTNCDFCGRELSYVSDKCKIRGMHQRTALENEGFNHDACIWCYRKIKEIIKKHLI